MFIINLYRFLFGYVDLKISGNFPERILNLCAANNVTVWNIRKFKEQLKISVMMKDFRAFRKIRGKSGIKVKILAKNGLPMYMHRYKLRVGALMGIALFFGVLYFLSCFVWQIDVVGNKRISDREILQICEAYGIKQGRYIKDIDTVLLKDKMLLDSDRFAWGAINIEGCKVTVNITEIKENKPEFTPSNMVSSNDAVIKKITLTSGTSQVYVGQAVSKGDIIISGIVEKGDRTEFIRSSGKIIGEIEETVVLSEKYVQTLHRHTGKESSKMVLEFFSFKMPLYLGKTAGKYNSTYTVENIKFLGCEIPIKIHKKDFEFYEEVRHEFSKDELIRRLEIRISNDMKNKKVDDIKITSREIIENSDGISIKYTLKYQKNLCIEQNLLFSTLN